VFVVEDDDLIRESMLELLEHEGFVVVGHAANSADAREALQTADAQIVLVDLGLGSDSGIDLIRAVSAVRDDLEFMVHTVFDDRDSVFRALKAGATSYVLKGSRFEEVCAALRDLHAGGSPMSPRIARLVIREFQEPDPAQSPPAEPDAITPRERQILRAIDSGQTYKEVAAELNISVHTVHSHIKSVYERLQSRGKRSALAEARRRGLL